MAGPCLVMSAEAADIIDLPERCRTVAPRAPESDPRRAPTVPSSFMPKLSQLCSGSRQSAQVRRALIDAGHSFPSSTNTYQVQPNWPVWANRFPSLVSDGRNFARIGQLGPTSTKLWPTSARKHRFLLDLGQMLLTHRSPTRVRRSCSDVEQHMPTSGQSGPVLAEHGQMLAKHGKLGPSLVNHCQFWG